KRRSTVVVALCVALAGCRADESLVPRIDRVTPASGQGDREVRIAIAGAGLAPDGVAPSVLLDELSLGGVALVDGGLTATVPAGLYPGPRDVRVVTSRYLVARLASG